MKVSVSLFARVGVPSAPELYRQLKSKNYFNQSFNVWMTI
jgi:hypothetical protein